MCMCCMDVCVCVCVCVCMEVDVHVQFAQSCAQMLAHTGCTQIDLPKPERLSCQIKSLKLLFADSVKLGVKPEQYSSGTDFKEKKCRAKTAHQKTSTQNVSTFCPKKVCAMLKVLHMPKNLHLCTEYIEKLVRLRGLRHICETHTCSTRPALVQFLGQP